ncbi:Uncharacterised protein (plasmid) [Tsukamurella tyrosinosolvens]|uniref:Uncharacterized protein n=1 Tax=Tsukamurella tyrosinosolvens TaxID=57704 RepID=A0A1H4VIC3_TSUTY|nr:hypothetical protein [Tsukamurella tyrosinosolvens]KXO90965.1 hypothetical protein AXK58_21270 [Tsukamurella tyrosinosolvens]SEC80757.1 hypothetical protein SAMN04489793_3238 [Tsukamurella tyrosinosolvens]VEH90497.1 Uncharacterised protein [Tsukamurella tyrosinosolvens]
MSLEFALQAAKGLERDMLANEFLDAEAYGLSIDNIEDPHTVVAVQDDRVVHIGLSDGILRLPPEEVVDAINTGLFKSFAMNQARKHAPPQ